MKEWGFEKIEQQIRNYRTWNPQRQLTLKPETFSHPARSMTTTSISPAQNAAAIAGRLLLAAWGPGEGSLDARRARA